MKKSNFLFALVACGMACNAGISAQEMAYNWEYECAYESCEADVEAHNCENYLLDNVTEPSFLKKLNDDNFEETIAKGDHVVECVGNWSPTSLAFEACFNSAIQDEDVIGKADFGKLNVDESPNMKDKYKISEVPTLLLFRDGKEMGRWSGMMSKEGIKNFILSSL